MSSESVIRAVSGRLSLRQPQIDSLRGLAAALETVPALRDRNARSGADLKAMTEALAGLFPMLTDFEREFPSLCFALATGVGKTRLMGAFISYLYTAFGYRNFFVLAPNLTIYEKLIRDFTAGTPKYVLTGIPEFATTPPLVITGDNYESLSQWHRPDGVEINVFNISKINTEVRGGRAPRIKRLTEYLGTSYFDYLKEKPDLVLMMDESHRYRAGAGVRVLNELNPLLSLELTATPFTESPGNRPPVPFRNVVFDYPLARAIDDGFVKDPAVATQQNFDRTAHTAEEIERIKLMDGIRMHEETKVHLLTYSRQTGKPPVKPFMLVIARDTAHARALQRLIATELFEGRYAGKVLQVDSGTTSGTEGDAVVQKLLAVERYDDPTEIVIHVNMLKEGWDVTNLYTIVPLRTANARTLIEQSIGRGLRLPYGRRTGVESVDRLNIVAHDRFQEVVDEAGRGDSPIRLKQIILTDSPDLAPRLRSVPVASVLSQVLGTAAQGESIGGPSDATEPATQDSGPLTAAQSKVAESALEIAYDLARATDGSPPAVTSSASLLRPEIRRQIVERVTTSLSGEQIALMPQPPAEIEAIVERTLSAMVEYTIDIPSIQVVPRGSITTGYSPFSLDVSRIRFMPVDRQLVSRSLQSGAEIAYGASTLTVEERPEAYLINAMLEFDDVSYEEHAALLQELASRTVAHLRTYLASDDELHNVLGHHARLIARDIHTQMSANLVEHASAWDVVVRRGFVPLRPSALTATGDTLTLQTPVPAGTRITSFVYGGFARCAYSVQKFDSDPERILASVLERDARRWFRPVVGQFSIYYRINGVRPEYNPDFAAATAAQNLLIEVKATNELVRSDVQAKARAGAEWCVQATAFTAANAGLPWRYLLIPDAAVNVSTTLDGLISQYTFG